ncbi:MAG: hypothetical protein R3D67_12725 [Hyphomicrobiaceae bacterium]
MSPVPGRAKSSDPFRAAGIVAACLATWCCPPAQAQLRSGVGVPPPAGVLQASDTVSLVVPKMLLAAPASDVALAIRIERIAALPPNSFVKIKGLPAKIALSEGHAIAPGSWAVPLKALDGLRLFVPAGLGGKSDVAISVVSVDGGVLATTRMALVVAAAAVPPRETTSARPANPVVRRPARTPSAAAPRVARVPAVEAPPPPAAAPALPRGSGASAETSERTKRAGLAAIVPHAAEPKNETDADRQQMSPESREQAREFIAKGKARLAQGNVSLARLFFERAADIGDPEAAIAMGDTFSPTELAHRGVIGVQPNVAEARRWYERARDLGAGAIALRKLERLGRR